MAFFRNYPFFFLFLCLALLIFTITWFYSRYDIKETNRYNSLLDTCSIAAWQFKDCVVKDTTGCSQRVLKSMMILKQRKNDALDDATWYYENTYIAAHLLGILSIFGSVIVLLVITHGWEKAGTDLKLTFGGVFMVCSTCYFLPRFMNNDVNYKSNMNTYYAFSKQLNYSTKTLSFHCCCFTGNNPDSLMIATADSNFEVISNNLAIHYDMNFDEATRYFDEFKSNQKGAKPVQ